MSENIAYLSCLSLGFSICMILTPFIIKYAVRLNLAHKICSYGPASHMKKFGTSNMGGVSIVFSIIVSLLVFCDVTLTECLVTIFALFGFGALGLFDDFAKIKGGKGLSARSKILAQALISLIACLALKYYSKVYSTCVYIPFTSIELDLGPFLSPAFSVFVICASSNAVNLTDGLDGLAIGVVFICALTFCAINLLGLDNPLGVEKNLTLICCAVIGSGVGFFLYNRHPAKIFMGDTGSLSLGAVLGLISVITKNQLFFAIIGGIFVLETLSVIIQLMYIKFSKGKRLFKMAPIHHHFEQMGISETKIVKSFWSISLLFSVLGLSAKIPLIHLA